MKIRYLQDPEPINSHFVFSHATQVGISLHSLGYSVSFTHSSCTLVFTEARRETPEATLGYCSVDVPWQHRSWVQLNWGIVLDGTVVGRD